MANYKGESDWYFGGAILTGIIAFIGIWIYAISEWGILIGLMVGWLPAGIGAFILGAIWPLVALFLLWVWSLGQM